MNQTHSFYPIDYIRILGMNTKGRNYIHQIKKDCPVKIISNFANIDSPLLQLELKATKLYCYALPIQERQSLIKREYQGYPIIIK